MDAIKSAISSISGKPSNNSHQDAPSSRYTQGISGGGGQAMGNVSTAGVSDSLSKYTLWLRGFTLIIFACSLIVSVVLAVFQSKWIGGPSGLTGFLLFSNVIFLVIVATFTAIPLIAERSNSKKWADLERALRENRVGFVGNGFCIVLGLIVAVTQLISSLTAKGCKDPAKDPHAKSSKGKEEDYKNALGEFCTSKRAQAAFLWLGWLCFVGLGVLFLITFKQSRKGGPRIPPFVTGETEGAFQPLDDQDEDHDAYDDGPRAYGQGYTDDYQYDQQHPSQSQSHQPPGSFNYRNPLSDIESRYGMTANANSNAPVHNPFADALAQAQPMANNNNNNRQSYDYGAYSQPQHNPYDAVNAHVSQSPAYGQQYHR